ERRGHHDPGDHPRGSRRGRAAAADRAAGRRRAARLRTGEVLVSAPPAAREPLPAPARLRPADSVRVGLVGVATRPLRAVLSALGLAIGIGAMVAVVGISGSSRQAILDQLAQLGTNLLRAAPGRTLFGEDATLPDGAEAMVGRIG